MSSLVRRWLPPCVVKALPNLTDRERLRRNHARKAPIVRHLGRHLPRRYETHGDRQTDHGRQIEPVRIGKESDVNQEAYHGHHVTVAGVRNIREALFARLASCAVYEKQRGSYTHHKENKCRNAAFSRDLGPGTMGRMRALDPS